jgi:hypothetical protein
MQVTVKLRPKTFTGRLIGISTYGDRVSIDLDQGKGKVYWYAAAEDVESITITAITATR